MAVLGDAVVGHDRRVVDDAPRSRHGQLHQRGQRGRARSGGGRGEAAARAAAGGAAVAQRPASCASSTRAYQASSTVRSATPEHRPAVRAAPAPAAAAPARSPIPASRARDHRARRRGRFRSHSHGPWWVSSKSVTSKSRSRSGEAKIPKFARWASPLSLHGDPGGRGRGQVVAMTAAAPRRNANGDATHASPPHGDQLGEPVPVLGVEERDRVGPVGGWRPDAVLGAAHGGAPQPAPPPVGAPTPQPVTRRAATRSGGC